MTHRPPGTVLDKELAALSREQLEAEVHALREQARLAQKKLRGIQEIGQILASEQNHDRVLAEIIKRTTALMGADRATLFILSDDHRTMWSKSTHGGEIKTIELEVGQGIAGWVARYKRQVNVKDAYKDARFDAEVDRLSGYRTTSILCQPLQDMQSNTIGVIQVLNKQDGYFTTADEQLLRAIGGQASVCILNSQLYIDVVTKNIDLLDTQLKLEERTREVELLFRVERAAALAMSREQALGGVLECTLGEYPSDGAVVLLHDPRRQALVAEHAIGPAALWLAEAQVALEGTIAGDVFSRREAQCLRQSDQELVDGLHLPVPPGVSLRNAVCVPITHNEDTFGVLLVVNRRDDPRGFEDRDVRILGVIASRIALSVMLSRAMDEEQKAERLAAIGKTLSGVVHDLKTPLTIISGYARALAREDDADRRQEYRALIKKQVDSITAMIQELLRFSRGESQLLMRKVWVKDFVAELAEALREEFASTGVELVVETPYRGAVRMDDQKMRRAAFNLARNAKEALSEHGGAFTVRVEEVDGRVRFAFSDDGPGIPPEMEGRLFESFATHGKKNGTGLGLAIVKRIVDEHEGTLEVTSIPGAGTTFTIGLAPA